MKKLFTFLLVASIVLSLVSCSVNNTNTGEQGSNGNTSAAGRPSAEAGNAQPDTTEETPTSSEAEFATRVIENGTAITLTIGNTVIPATLNDSTSSKDLLSRLPYTVNLRRYVHDYCGVMDDPLEYDEADVHRGWLNGDLGFARDGNYFVIFFDDEEISEKFDHQITLGKVDVDLSVVKALGDSIEVTIALAEGTSASTQAENLTMQTTQPSVSPAQNTPPTTARSSTPPAQNTPAAKIPPSESPAESTSAEAGNNNEDASDSKIRLIVDDTELTATLLDNETARDFISLLPLTLTFSDYARTEKVSDPPRNLSTEGAPAGFDPSTGDITLYAPWGNLAIFYKDFGYASGLVPIGRIDSGIETLADMSGNFTVTIERID